MYQFLRRAPLDVTPYPPPSIEDRAGPPLTQGFLFTLLITVASAELPTHTVEALSCIDPDAWYHGQLLETIINDFEDKDPGLPLFFGRTIYFMTRDHLEKAGIHTATALLEAIPTLWMQLTRGDGGVWRTSILGPGRAHIEAEQPYNCRFEEGAVYGFLESYGARDIRIDHRPCRRDESPFCVFDVTWQE